jgi:hypothetical protein
VIGDVPEVELPREDPDRAESVRTSVMGVDLVHEHGRCRRSWRAERSDAMSRHGDRARVELVPARRRYREAMMPERRLGDAGPECAHGERDTGLAPADSTSPPSLPGERVRELTKEMTELRVSRWVPLEMIAGAAAWLAAGPQPAAGSTECLNHVVRSLDAIAGVVQVASGVRSV